MLLQEQPHASRPQPQCKSRCHQRSVAQEKCGAAASQYFRHIRNERADTKNPIQQLNKQVVDSGLEVLPELEV